MNQITLFRYDHPEDFAPKLHGEFVGRELPYAEITKFTLNETPFFGPIQMLKVLLGRRQIEVTWIDPKRTNGLSKTHVSKVKFLDKPPFERIEPIGGKQEELFGGN
jgi:hypothetical protein